MLVICNITELCNGQWPHLTEGSRKKTFFSGQSNKAFSHPPPGLVDKRTIFLIKYFKKPVKYCMSLPSDDIIQVNFNIWIRRLKQNIFNF